MTGENAWDWLRVKQLMSYQRQLVSNADLNGFTCNYLWNAKSSFICNYLWNLAPGYPQLERRNMVANTRASGPEKRQHYERIRLAANQLTREGVFSATQVLARGLSQRWVLAVALPQEDFR